MIVNRGNADAGAMDAGAPPELRSALLDRRSFLFGSAAGLGALALSGCATSDDLLRAEAAKVYGPAPDEKFPIPAVDVSKIDPKYFRKIVDYDSLEAPGTIIIDPRITISTASKATERPPATAPMSAAPSSCGAATPMSGARPNGPSGRRPRR